MERAILFGSDRGEEGIGYNVRQPNDSQWGMGRRTEISDSAGSEERENDEVNEEIGQSKVELRRK